MLNLLLILATILSVIGTVDYILSILRGETKPHRTTRFVLLIVSIVNLVGSIAVEAQMGVMLLSVLFLVRSLTLALLSLKYGVGGTSRLDIACAVIAVLGIVAWQVTDNGIWALVFVIIADAVAYIPAIIKTWKAPKTEAPLLYILEAVAASLGVIHDGLIISTIFQVYVVLSCVAMLMCIYRYELIGRKIRSTHENLPKSR